MAERRFVNSMTWQDGYFRGLKDDEKLVYLYLLTTPSVTYFGTIKTCEQMVAAEIGQAPETVGAALDRFSADNKITREPPYWVVVNFFAENQSGDELPPRSRAALLANKYEMPPVVLDQTLRNWGLVVSDLTCGPPNGESDTLSDTLSDRESDRVSDRDTDRREKVEGRKGKEEWEGGSSTPTTTTTPSASPNREPSHDGAERLAKRFAQRFLNRQVYSSNLRASSAYPKFKGGAERIADYAKRTRHSEDRVTKDIFDALAQEWTKDGKVDVKPGNLSADDTWDRLLPQYLNDLYGGGEYREEPQRSPVPAVPAAIVEPEDGPPVGRQRRRVEPVKVTPEEEAKARAQNPVPDEEGEQDPGMAEFWDDYRKNHGAEMQRRTEALERNGQSQEEGEEDDE
jgi:hypothetical protein